MNARSNAAGVYRFDLTGDQTEILGIATVLALTAGEADGPQLRREVQVLSPALRLPEMRFWNGLTGPPAEALLSGERAVFGWQPPAEAVEGYRFSLLDAAGDQVWRSETVTAGLEVPLAVLEPDRAYHWQVSARHAGYDALSAPRPVHSGALPSRGLKIRSITIRGRSYPSFHDGRFAAVLDDRLDFPDAGVLELDVRLESPAPISGLHWAGSGFAASLEVNTGTTAILRHTVADYTLLSWAPVQTDRLLLRLSEAKGFTDLAELRILGPSQAKTGP